MYAIKLASAALSCLSPRVSCIRNLTTVTKFTRVFTILLQVWVLNSIPHQSRRRLHIGSLQGIFTVRWRNEVTDVETSLSNKKLRGVYNIRPIMRRQLGWIDGVLVLPECRPTVSCYVYYGELFIGVTSLDGGLGYLPSLKLAHVYQFGNLFT